MVFASDGPYLKKSTQAQVRRWRRKRRLRTTKPAEVSARYRQVGTRATSSASRLGEARKDRGARGCPGSNAVVHESWPVVIVGYEQRVNDKLQPGMMQTTLAFTGLYEVTYEISGTW